jgi:DNA polymerase-4
MAGAAEPHAVSVTESSSPDASDAPFTDVRRRILHCDMDCFFAAVHMRDDPSLRGKPVLIGGSPEGRGVVAAANYEARRFGVRSATPAVTALRRCPHAVFIRPDFPRYRRESDAIFSILREISPVIQPISIDEAFVDVSDTYEQWGSATAVAQAIRERIREERGLTVSVGVGPNKLVAKIASDFDKPDGLTVVAPGRVGDFLAPMSVRALPGVGPATEKVLARHGIARIVDLRSWDEERLSETFGRYGRRLYRHALGLDDRPVRTHRSRKSLGSERTFAEDLVTLDEMTAEIRRLADQVARNLARRELSFRTVSIKVRYEDFTTVSRARTLARRSEDGSTLGRIALDLLARTDAGKRRVRLLGVSTSGFDSEDVPQLSLFPAD